MFRVKKGVFVQDDEGVVIHEDEGYFFGVTRGCIYTDLPASAHNLRVRITQCFAQRL